MKDKALAFLEKDLLRNMDIIDPLRFAEPDIIYAEDDGVVIYEYLSKSYMLACDDEAAERLCSLIPDTAELLSCHSEKATKLLAERGYSLYMKVYSAVYLRTEIPAQDERFMIAPLNEGDIPLVRKYYHTVDDEEYIRGIIGRGNLFGAYLGTEITGFAGFHAEGSIGLLEVLPQHRRMGAATALEAFLIAECRRRGKYPYCQVEEDNDKSFKLQKKLGFEICPQAMYWLENQSESICSASATL